MISTLLPLFSFEMDPDSILGHLAFPDVPSRNWHCMSILLPQRDNGAVRRFPLTCPSPSPLFNARLWARSLRPSFAAFPKTDDKYPISECHECMCLLFATGTFLWTAFLHRPSPSEQPPKNPLRIFEKFAGPFLRDFDGFPARIAMTPFSNPEGPHTTVFPLFAGTIPPDWPPNLWDGIISVFFHSKRRSPFFLPRHSFSLIFRFPSTRNRFPQFFCSIPFPLSEPFAFTE